MEIKCNGYSSTSIHYNTALNIILLNFFREHIPTRAQSTNYTGDVHIQVTVSFTEKSQTIKCDSG